MLFQVLIFLSTLRNLYLVCEQDLSGFRKVF
jgi:hypothetical protein